MCVSKGVFERKREMKRERKKEKERVCESRSENESECARAREREGVYERESVLIEKRDREIGGRDVY